MCSKPRIFAHRGTTVLAPENTNAAFDLALSYGCDVLETDVRMSKDGRVIVTHDETLERTTNTRGRVIDRTLSELKQLDAAIHFRDLNNQPYDGPRQQLQTLEELFDRYPTVGINIDIKDRSIDAAKAVANILKRHNRSDKQWVNVCSFHADVIKQFRTLAPSISTAATRQEVAQLVFGQEKRIKPAYQVLQIPASYWGIQLSGARLISKANKLGCDIIYWTINDTTKMTQLLNRGCSGLVTDRPDLAMQVFEKKGLK